MAKEREERYELTGPLPPLAMMAGNLNAYAAGGASALRNRVSRA